MMMIMNSPRNSDKVVLVMVVLTIVCVMTGVASAASLHSRGVSAMRMMTPEPLHDAARAFFSNRGIDAGLGLGGISDSLLNGLNISDGQCDDSPSSLSPSGSCSSSRESIMRQITPLLGLLLPSPTQNISVFGNGNYTLSPPCSQQYCDFLNTALSCKALPVKMPKICAKYFLGALLKCPSYPPLDQFLNAPLLCAESYAKLIAALAKRDALEKLQQEFFQSDMSENCGRRCYQNYISQGKALFYGDNNNGCRAEFLNEISLRSASSIGSKSPTTSHYPFLEMFYLYRMFRQQSCVSSSTSEVPGMSVGGGNCFEQVRPSAPLLLELVRSDSDATFACQKPAITPTVQADIFNVFNSLGCCYGSVMSYLLQSPTNLSEIPVFPPCQFHYTTKTNPSVSPSKVCHDCSNSNMTVIEFQMNITGQVGTNIDKISVFSRRDVLKIMEAFTTYLVTPSDLRTQKPSAAPTAAPTFTNGDEIKSFRLFPYYLDLATPFYFQITNYQYWLKQGTINPKYVPQFPTATTPVNFKTLMNQANFLTLDMMLTIQGIPSQTYVDALVAAINNQDAVSNPLNPIPTKLSAIFDGLFSVNITNKSNVGTLSTFAITGIKTHSVHSSAFQAAATTPRSSATGRLLWTSGVMAWLNIAQPHSSGCSYSSRCGSSSNSNSSGSSRSTIVILSCILLLFTALVNYI